MPRLMDAGMRLLGEVDTATGTDGGMRLLDARCDYKSGCGYLSSSRSGCGCIRFMSYIQRCGHSSGCG